MEPAAHTRVSSPTLHLTVLVTMSVFVAMVTAAYILRIEVIASGTGRIVPEGQVQIVQPEFSGRIAEILVQNGSEVQQGDPLIRLDPTDAKAEQATLHAERERLVIERARLQAMLRALDDTGAGFHDRALAAFTVPEQLNDHPFASEQRSLLAAEARDILAALDEINARDTSNRRSEVVTEAEIARIDAAIKIQTERLETAQQLLARGSASRARFLDEQQEYLDLESERTMALRELEFKEAQRSVFASERTGIVAGMRRAMLVRQSEIDSRLAELEEQARIAARRVRAAELVAPATGIVDQSTIHTIGGIAAAGSELLRIVPTAADLVVEGTFTNQDIGFMQVGQMANVRLDAYPSERFGMMKGTVTHISADSIEQPDETWGFQVRITLNNDHLTVGPNRYPLRPGMTTVIDVTTDHRRIISYFFAPVMRTLQDALGER